MPYDFHTHTFLSDGDLSPIELIRRALVNGYDAIAITDHASPSTIERVVDEVRRDCDMATLEWGIRALPGVELTHCPAASIAHLAAWARRIGASVVVVHGETLVEPVEEGTNRAAVRCPDVDILAHPGLVTAEEAGIAAESGVFLEITCRKGHCLTNGHVARLAKEAGARLLVNTDAHSPSDLLTDGFARRVAIGAGLTEEEADVVLRDNAQALLKRILRG